MFKNNKSNILFLFFFMIILLSTMACSSNKTGCPMNEQATASVDKKGKLTNKKGKSGLFPKNFKKTVSKKKKTTKTTKTTKTSEE